MHTWTSKYASEKGSSQKAQIAYPFYLSSPILLYCPFVSFAHHDPQMTNNSCLGVYVGLGIGGDGFRQFFTFHFLKKYGTTVFN